MIDKKINELKTDIDELKDKLIQIIQNDEKMLDEDFFNKLNESIGNDQKLSKILKSFIIMASILDTNKKNTNTRLYSIFQSLVDQKSNTIEIIDYQYTLLKELKENVKEFEKSIDEKISEIEVKQSENSFVSGLKKVASYIFMPEKKNIFHYGIYFVLFILFMMYIKDNDPVVYEDVKKIVINKVIDEK